MCQLSAEEYLLKLNNKDMSIAIYTCLSRIMPSIIVSLIKYEYLSLEIRFAYSSYHKEAFIPSDIIYAFSLSKQIPVDYEIDHSPNILA